MAATGLPVLAFAHPGPAAADVADLTRDLRDRGADVRLTGPVDGSTLPWPAEAPSTAVTRGTCPEQLAWANRSVGDRVCDLPSARNPAPSSIITRGTLSVRAISATR